MGKHTPGPWNVNAKSGHINIFGNFEFVAEASNMADGRLIAAAPEMLEALKRARHFIPSNAQPRNDFEADQRAVWELIRAAIAKAEQCDPEPCIVCGAAGGHDPGCMAGKD